ncbi:MAG: N-acetyltransferase [Actinomycetota bacterium]|nr:N-acetyltransferase [Actinomycetota bacterium]
MGDPIQLAVTLDDDVSLCYPSSRESDPRLVLGEGAHIRSGTVLYAGSRIGRRFETGHHVVIREQNRLGDDVSVWSNSVIDYGCVIGNRTKIHCNCYVSQFTDIEDDVFLAPGVTIANDLFPGFEESARAMRGPSIGTGAQIGVNVTILPYVRIGEHAIIGAGSVVTRDIPPYTVAYGVPALPKRDVADVQVRDRVLQRADAEADERRPWPDVDLDIAHRGGHP